MESAISKCAPLQIPVEDVIKATENFHHDNIITRDTFGTIYKGRLLQSGNLINITARRLDRQHGLGDTEFWTEVTVLSDLKHTNLISLIGFCDEKDEKIIVTTHEVKGSVGEYLKNPSLTLTQRLRICVGVARALSYLHYDEGRGYGVMHLNINRSTVLLDENWEAKLSGFQNSIKQFYKDPSIEKTGGVTHNSDIYSFGVLLYEILSGKEARGMSKSPARRCSEEDLMQQLIHPDLRNQVSPQSHLICSKVAYSCLEKEPAHPTNIDYIVAELEKALSLQLNQEVKSDHVVESSHELNSMTMQGQSSAFVRRRAKDVYVFL
ncbi:receptor-like protein kinase ANXUR2 [Bidens hawaiensis]|uniref:receptor-like protein kinase ANXUR2 n=1 Tax=Bidens hawaiensis TaxID=980011 RepID=UPI004049D032